jgi:hypothetical protein
LAEIKAQSISEALKKKLDPKKEAEILAAQVCYDYPRYSLHEALRLPYKHVRLLLQTAGGKVLRAHPDSGCGLHGKTFGFQRALGTVQKNNGHISLNNGSVSPIVIGSSGRKDCMESRY